MFIKSFGFLLALGVPFATGVHAAQDKITLNTGQVIEGTVETFDRANQRVFVQETRGRVPYLLANIQSIQLGPRRELGQARKALEEENPSRAIELLEPLVNNLLGLNDPIVAEAAGVLAESYMRAGQRAKANEVFANIENLYPDSIYRLQGQLIRARSEFAGGALDAALKTLEAVEKAVKPQAAPDAATMQIMGDLLMMRAEIREKQNRKADALSDYLKVVAIFHQPPTRSKQAAEAAARLRQADSSLFVP